MVPNVWDQSCMFNIKETWDELQRHQPSSDFLKDAYYLLITVILTHYLFCSLLYLLLDLSALAAQLTGC